MTLKMTRSDSFEIPAVCTPQAAILTHFLILDPCCEEAVAQDVSPHCSGNGVFGGTKVCPP